MKISLILSAALALVLGLFGGKRAAEISRAREDCARLEIQARSSGLDMGDAVLGLRERHPSATRPDVKDLTRRMVAFSGRAGEFSRAKKPWDREMAHDGDDLMAELLQLEPREIERFLRDLRESPDVDPDGYRDVICGALTLLASDDPKAALEFCGDTSGLSIKPWLIEQATRTALKHWGMKDPRAALAWVGTDGDGDPVSGTVMRKWDVLDGAASQDARMAFSLVPELPEFQRQGAAGEVARSARDDSSRVAVLQGLRDYVARNPDSSAVVDETLKGLTYGLAESDFDHSQNWLDTVQLSRGEVQGLLANIDHVGMGGDLPKWINRIAGQLPEDGGRQAALQQAYDTWHKSNPLNADRLAGEIGFTTSR